MREQGEVAHGSGRGQRQRTEGRGVVVVVVVAAISLFIALFFFFISLFIGSRLDHARLICAQGCEGGEGAVGAR